MKPPAARRPGFSRKAHFGLFISYVIAIAGMVVALLLLVIAIVDPRGFGAIKGAALDATAPVSRGGRTVVRGFTGLGDGISNYFRAGSQNAQLQRELAEARRALVAAQTAQAENQRLHALLQLAREAPDEIAVARIVGSTFESPRQLATLSAGRASGVRVGQPVRAADGLVGRVIETGIWASRVMLLSDGASSVPVRALRNGTPALAVGRGDGTVELRTLEVGSNPFRRGDILVTSGVGGLFPPNVPAARVIRLEGDTAIAQPLADPARIDFAIVQPVYQPAAAGPLELAPAAEAAPPVTAPLSAAGGSTPARLQANPRYQPALQQPSSQPAAAPRSPQ
jgi:rod shape-determining protein MreC